jgi:heterodisulfide reductase subunit D
MVELGYGPVGDQRLTEAIVREKRNPYEGPHEARFDWLPADVKVATKADVGYFAGCSGSYTAQPMMIGAVKVMQATGIEFTMLSDEWCCGFPLMILGELGLLEELITHNVEGFIERGIERLVVSCPCCMFMIKEHWPYYFGRALPFDLAHISQVIVERIGEGKLKLAKELPKTITYHDPCYLARGTRVTEEPRQVIAQFKGINFAEMKENRELAKCCGAGGGIRRAYKQLSIDMGRALIRDAEAVGADIMVIDCPACYERLHLALEDFATPVKIMDLMQLTAELL